MDTPRDSPAPGNAQTHTTHYAIVKQMMNFQSIDVGPHCERSETVNSDIILIIFHSPLYRSKLDACTASCGR